MKLRTTIDIKPLSHQITYDDRLLMMGSCFAQNIGERVLRAKFRATVNPLGTLFNPLSICNSLERLYRGEQVSVEELREGDLGWYHYDFHSSFNGATAEQCAEGINRAICSSGEALREASCVVLTLGTAFVYEREGRVVANCHKEPARNFNRYMVSVEHIVERMLPLLDGVLRDKNVILTVSPIRHLSDGVEDNSLSKATLRLAIEQLRRARPEQVCYFPSYEIMMDDLRDYRFYDEDMLHPSPLAVEYIWAQFSAAALSRETIEVMARVMKVVRAAEHRAINPTSDAHLRHCQAQLRAIEQLPQIDFENERGYFDACLKINL